MIPRQRGVEFGNKFDEYLWTQWRLLRQANQKSVEASRKWDDLSAQIKAKAEAEGWAHELQKMVNTKAANLTLKGYADEAEWWRKESLRISGTITAELALKEYFADVQRPHD